MSEAIDTFPLKRRDLRELLLIAKVYFPTEAWLNPDYLERIERGAIVKKIIRWGPRLLGGLIITPDKHPNAWLDLMVIDRNFGRRGLGEKLLLSAERDLPSGLMLWHLVPDKKDFASSKKFLEKMGFEDKGTLDGWYDGRTGGSAFKKRIR
jgi:hypothetical protein